jgi:hypothetical protein
VLGQQLHASDLSELSVAKSEAFGSEPTREDMKPTFGLIQTYWLVEALRVQVEILLHQQYPVNFGFVLQP